MAKKIAERLIWAVNAMAIDPADRVLEVGCGHGVAVSLVCEKLDDGTITAIDRSATMIGMAERRNHEHVSSGKATFQAVTLDEADFADQQFDKIFAIHVSVFWQQSRQALTIVKRLLAPDGALFLFNQPLVERDAPVFIENLTATLRDHGFGIDRVVVGEVAPRPVVGVVAVSRSDHRR